MNTELVGYRTAYARATETRGAKIKVLNLITNQSRLVPMDFAVGGGEAQHEHAIREVAAGDIVSVDVIGSWEKGYYFVVERVGEEGI